MEKKKIDITDRLTYLAQQFDIFDEIDVKLLSLKEEGFVSKQFMAHGTSTAGIGAVVTIVSKKELPIPSTKISVSSQVFSDMIVADPTEHKIFIQWMLNIFTRLLREDKVESTAAAIRFVVEDLPQANFYLELFEGNKRKKIFKELALANYSLKKIIDPTDINQYKTLAQLFDAVDPFIMKNPTEMESLLQKYVDSGKALMPVKDRKFTLFIPKTLEASVLFNNYANWCTTTPNNGMFKRYTEENRKPNGKKSDIYIIINNLFYKEESDEIYQIHFETEQVKDKSNASNVNIFNKVINESEGIANFFKEELTAMAKEDINAFSEKNLYLKALIDFGFTDSLFDILEEDTTIIRFIDRKIRKMPDLSRFKNLESLVISNAELTNIHPSIGKLTKLEILSVSSNNIVSIPKEISSLKNLLILNIKNNNIQDIPTEIKYLDKNNGGSLLRVSVNAKQIGERNYMNLKEWLSTTDVE